MRISSLPHTRGRLFRRGSANFSADFHARERRTMAGVDPRDRQTPRPFASTVAAIVVGLFSLRSFREIAEKFSVGERRRRRESFCYCFGKCWTTCILRNECWRKKRNCITAEICVPCCIAVRYSTVINSRNCVITIARRNARYYVVL